MARELLPTSEDAPSRRRYELTPVFWVPATVIVGALLTAIVVLLSVQMTYRAQIADALHALGDSLAPKGHCRQSQEEPWKMAWVGCNPRSVTSLQSGYTSAVELSNWLNGNQFEDRRLSEMAIDSAGAGGFCPFSNEAECNAVDNVPYIGLLLALSSLKFALSNCENAVTDRARLSPEIANYVCYDSNVGKKQLLRPDEWSTYYYDIPANYELDLCYTTSAGNPCTPTQTEQTEKVLQKLMEVYAYPCQWETETLGSFLSARSPFAYAAQVWQSR